MFKLLVEHGVIDAIVYCRVSSPAQVRRGDGLGSQETRCRHYANYKGYTVTHVFTDDLTGKTADRNGFMKLIAFLKKQKGKKFVVIVDDLNRIARSVPIHFEIRKAIADAGGILETPSIELRDDADGELQEYLLATVAQHQRRKNEEQTLNRMMSRMLNGYWVFSKPIGYVYQLQSGRGNVLVRDEPIASIIQEALEGFATGRFQTQVEVKRFLESHVGVFKREANGEIAHQRVKDILTRKIYAGYVEHELWDIPLRKGQHEGLITLEMYQHIQERLSKSAKVPARKDVQIDFPLRGFVNCAECEKPLTSCWSTSKTGKNHPYYMCYNKACGANRKSIRRDDLHGGFEDILRSMQPTNALYKLLSDV